LAKEIVGRFHGGPEAGNDAMQEFIARFRQGEMPENMPEVSVPAGPIAGILKQAGLVASTSEALRMIDAGGVRINGEKLADKGLVLKAGVTVVLQVGKRKFARVTLT
jgi:tyrosyl-tRNA synthetase